VTGWRGALWAVLLLAASAVAAQEPDGTTELHRAVYAGDITATLKLLREGADVRAANNYGATAMSLAAVVGDTQMLQVLLAAGADPESPNDEGQTALMTVARTGNVASAKLLLRYGADLHAKEKWGGQNALMWAAAQQQPEMIRFLLSRGAKVNERAIVRDWQRRVTAEGRPKDLNRGGLTPLLYAAREGCIACVRELLAGKADLNLADPDGTTPLILALMNLHWDTARYLVEAGADVNLWDFYGQTPLYLAVDLNTLPTGRRVDLPSLDRTSGIEMIGLLLDKGANPNAQLKLRPKYRNVVNDRYMDPMIVWGTTPLLRAAKAGDAPAVKLLLAHGALANLANSQGVTPLMAAVGDGHIHDPTRGRFRTEEDALECYDLLRAAGADVNAQTPLGYADADLKVLTPANRTALHAAASRGWNEVVKRLVADGAHLDVADSNGLTAIDYAMGRFPKLFNAKQPEIYADTVKLLRQLGATRENPTATFAPGTTPRITAIVPE
jgi:ankyrin repeat protein